MMRDFSQSGSPEKQKGYQEGSEGPIRGGVQVRLEKYLVGLLLRGFRDFLIKEHSRISNKTS